MNEIKKNNLCWQAMNHALDVIRAVYSENCEWEDEEVREQFYKALDVAVWFSEREDAQATQKNRGGKDE